MKLLTNKEYWRLKTERSRRECLEKEQDILEGRLKGCRQEIYGKQQTIEFQLQNIQELKHLIDELNTRINQQKRDYLKELDRITNLQFDKLEKIRKGKKK